jgi:hypothetical protein
MDAIVELDADRLWCASEDRSVRGHGADQRGMSRRTCRRDERGHGEDDDDALHERRG